MKVSGCIPARYASSRLPGKPLREIAGKAMILHVVEKASRCQRLDEIVVLTDDERIADAVIAAGHQAVMTSAECASGTDRIAEFMQQSDSDIFVNIQGDEVTLDPRHIDRLIEDFLSRSKPQMGTLAHRCEDAATLSAASSVKVVTSCTGRALYFSRNMIPVTQQGDHADAGLIHIGVYIYTRETLAQLMNLSQTPLETTEKLEQLRALENDISIDVAILDDYQGLAVDTPEDLEAARRLFSTRS